MTENGNWSGEYDCPHCKAKQQVAEDMGDIETWLTGMCEECGKGFSYDTVKEIFYDDSGEEIK